MIIANEISYLVLDLADGVYKSEEAKKYLANLHSQVQKELNLNQLFSECIYCEDMIKARKFKIHETIFNYLKNNQVNQVIILGSGFSPLSLEISSHFPQLRIFEIDCISFSLKKELYKFKNQPNIFFIKENIANSQKILKALQKNSWFFNVQTLVVAEGLSYYIPKKMFWQTIELFKSQNKKNLFIFDYFISQNEIATASSMLVKANYEVIKKYLNLKHLTRYTRKDVFSFLKKMGATKINIKFVFETAQKSSNSQNLVNNKNNGWLGVVFCLI